MDLTDPNKTAFQNHHFQRNHDFDFENVSIVDFEDNYKKRLIGEMVMIQKKSINKKQIRII